MAYRKEKIEEQMRRLISELMIKEIKDPRIGFASITEVNLNKDFTWAKVGISVLGNPREIRKTLEGLNSAKNFIQSKLGKLMRLRHTPKIEFFLDSTIAESVEMINLLNKLEEEESEEDDDITSEDEKSE